MASGLSDWLTQPGTAGGAEPWDSGRFPRRDSEERQPVAGSQYDVTFFRRAVNIAAGEEATDDDGRAGTPSEKEDTSVRLLVFWGFSSSRLPARPQLEPPQF